MTEPSITPADIEAKFRSIQGEIETVSSDSKKIVQLVAVGGAIILVGVIYLLGRRAGKRKSTVVEIRRL